jgi:hypothetical protein
MDVVRSIALFVVAAVAEPGGARLVWQRRAFRLLATGLALMLVMHVISQDISTSRCGCFPVRLEAPTCPFPICV